MDIKPEIAVSFTGNRRLTPPLNLAIQDINGDIRIMLASILAECYNSGKRLFLSGGAIGFDMIAAEEVLRLRESHADVKLIFVVPFEGQEAKYPHSYRELYYHLLSQADHIVTLSKSYSIKAYHIRNEYLISHCSSIIAYNNSERKGGTSSTIKRATKHNLNIINIYDMLVGINIEEQLKFEF